MSKLVPLSFLLAENSKEDPPVEPVTPFDAVRYDQSRPDPEVSIVVTALLERTAAFHALNDRHDTGALRFDLIHVVPEEVKWKAATGARLTENGQVARVTPYNGRSSRGSAEERQAAREASDRRALENRAQVARVAAAEAALDASKRLKDLSDRASQPPASSPSFPLKFCPGCKLEKPRSEFPPGKGWFQCNDCRAAKALTATPDPKALEREALAKQGLKHCPSCDQDKAFDEFDRNASKADGYQSLCRACRSATWTAGSTAVRRAREGFDSAPSLVVEQPAPAVDEAGENDANYASSIPLTSTGGVPRLLERIRILRQERDEARAELAQVYAALEEALS